MCKERATRSFQSAVDMITMDHRIFCRKTSVLRTCSPRDECHRACPKTKDACVELGDIGAMMPYTFPLYQEPSSGLSWRHHQALCSLLAITTLLFPPVPTVPSFCLLSLPLYHTSLRLKNKRDVLSPHSFSKQLLL